MKLVARTLSFESLDVSAREQWLELLRGASVDLSMAPQWFEATVKSSGIGGRAHVFMLCESGRLVGLIPFFLGTERAAGISARSRECPGSQLVAYHPEVLSLIDPETVLEIYLRDAARHCDVVVLPNIAKDGRTATAVRAVARRLRIGYLERAGHASPYLTIAGDWETFLAGKSRKFRYNLRARRKNLEEAGAVVERWFSGGTEIEALVADILRVEQSSWKLAAGMAISASEKERSYYRLLLPFIAGRQALYANVLYLDAQPIAYSLCYVSDGCIRQLKTSFDARYNRVAPGILCHQTALRRAYEIGAREFDFLGDVMAHKTLWSGQVREHVSIYLFMRSWRGVALGGARRLARWLRQGSTAGSASSGITGAVANDESP